MDRVETFQRIKKKIDMLPLFDSDIFKIIALLDDKDSDFEQIINNLSPGIAAKFLSVANSSYYGQEIKSINHALRVLGFNGMKNILVTSILYDQYCDDVVHKYFNVSKFHLEARFCVIVSSVIGKIFEYNQPEKLFTVALVHDIGKLVVAANFTDEIQKINEIKDSKKMPSRKAELEVLGVPHSIIGAYLLKKMKISRDIYYAVAQHEEKKPIVSEKGDYRLVLILREASIIINRYFLPNEKKLLEIFEKLNAMARTVQGNFQQNFRKAMLENGQMAAFKQQLPFIRDFIFKELGDNLEERFYPAA
ncbi:MAG: HDOD domain-containing protein [Desulfobacterales bacterium]|nr:HDOD domain-containing protein [Desulfobacterales bacterium]